MNPFMTPYGDGRREMGAYLARVGGTVGAAGYGVYDAFTGETNGLNSGEIPMNYALALTPGLGAGAGYAAGGFLTPSQPEVGGRDIRRSRRAQYGAAIGALATAPFAINAMRDRDQPAGLTSNVPMQEVQELNDLLGANGAY